MLSFDGEPVRRLARWEGPTCLASTTSAIMVSPAPSRPLSASSLPWSRPTITTVAPCWRTNREHSSDPMPPAAPNTTYTTPILHCNVCIGAEAGTATTGRDNVCAVLLGTHTRAPAAQLKPTWARCWRIRCVGPRNPSL